MNLPQCSAHDVTSQNKGRADHSGDLGAKLIDYFSFVLVINSLQNGVRGEFSLASTSDSEEGALPSPPRKKLCLNTDIKMQTNGCSPHNGAGEESTSNGVTQGATNGVTNGATSMEETPPALTSQIDKDVVRLIGQHLRSIGLK